MPDLPERIHAGLMIEYRVRPVANIPLTWLTEITRVEPETYFVDEQRLGPYALWHHEHWVRPAGTGKIEIEDRVTEPPKGQTSVFLGSNVLVDTRPFPSFSRTTRPSASIVSTSLECNPLCRASIRCPCGAYTFRVSNPLG